MGNKQRPVTVEASKDSNGKITFEMLEKGKKTGTLTFDKDKDKMKKKDNYDIHFDLVNQDGLNLEFLQDSQNVQNVMWVAKGTATAPPACPPSQTSDPEFTVTSVTASTLDVTNTDQDQCMYKFALNFIDTGNGNKAEQFDPIYDNKNGGINRSILSNAVVVGGLVAAACLVAIVAMERVGWLG
ncbi:MAG: hypothetical protein ABIW03_00800 [Sphingomicrobium sp.]